MIYLSAGKAKILNNTIGSQTVANNIFITPRTSGAFYGIYLRAVNTEVTGNTIGGITISSSSYPFSFSGIHLQNVETNGAYGTISNNIIGSPTTQYSIFNTTNSETYGISCSRTISMEFIYNAGLTYPVLINNNLIANLNGTNAGTATKVRGISLDENSNTITNNTIRDLYSNTTSAYTDLNSYITGIYLGGSAPNQVISGNIVYSVANTNAGNSTGVVGIHLNTSSAGNLVDRNFVHSLKVLSTITTSSYVYGIAASNGAATYKNNMVRLGIDANGNSLTNSTMFYGIYKASNSPSSFFHNTIFLGGQNISSNNASSFCFRRLQNPGEGVDSMINNIFVNQRSNSTGANGHYNIVLNQTARLVLDNNLYFGNGSGYIFGYTGSSTTVDFGTFAQWKAGNRYFDQNSFFRTPGLVNPTGNSALVNLHLNTSSWAEGNGVKLSSVANDFDGQLRDTLTPNDLGADAGNYGSPFTDVSVSALLSPGLLGCVSSTQKVIAVIKNFSSNPVNFSTNNIAVTVSATGNANYTSTATVTTGILQAGDTLQVAMPATIDMGSNGQYNFSVFVVVTSGSADVNPVNDTLPVISRSVAVLGGSYTVGTGGNFTTITAALNAYNAASCFTGSVIFRLINTSYSSETFPLVVAYNSAANVNTLTIKPSAGVAPIISGDNAIAIFDLKRARNFILDGSNLVNGNSKNLLVRNTNSSAATIRLTDDASKNKIINCNVEGSAQGNFSNPYTNAVMLIGEGYVAGNDSNLISGNLIRDRSDAIGVPDNLLGFIGTSAVIANSFNVISNNILKNFKYSGIFTNNGYNVPGSLRNLYISITTTDNLSILSNEIFQETSRASILTGILIGNVIGNNYVLHNKIHDLVSNQDIRGIYVGDARNVFADENKLYNFNSGTGVTSKITGMQFDPYYTSPEFKATFSNNMISIATTAATNQGIYGIRGTRNISLYYNTVYLGGYASGSTPTWALYNEATNCTILNNIFFNGRTGGGANHFAAYGFSGNSTTYVLDYNVYAGTGAVPAYFLQLGTNAVQPTLWKAGPPARDAHSKFSTAGGGNYTETGMFISTSDLHAVATSPAIAAAIPVVGITHDFDGEGRNPTAPDAGADELNGTPPHYVFMGDGNISSPSNWEENNMPPLDLPAGSEIIINPVNTCILDIPQNLLNPSRMTIKAGKKLIIPGNVTSQ